MNNNELPQKLYRNRDGRELILKSDNRYYFFGSNVINFPYWPDGGYSYEYLTKDLGAYFSEIKPQFSINE